MNLIFDLGNVVVRWDPDALIARTFANPAVHGRVRAEIVDHADWVALDRGTLAPAEAAARGARRTGLAEAEIAEFLRRVPASLTAIPQSVELLRRLKARGHALYCLSNMQVEAIRHLEATHDFWDVFTGRVISCRLQICKPEPGIYAHLLQSYGLRGGESVFIDDVPANLEAAAAFGIRGILFRDPAQCERELAALGAL